MIEDFPELEFIGGGEESFGFMVVMLFVTKMPLQPIINEVASGKSKRKHRLQRGCNCM
jgi:hypothetical protein